MQTLILGRRSNLTQALVRAWPRCVAFSAQDLLEGQPLPIEPTQPVRVVINSFQPATGLGDVSDPVGWVQRAIGATARLLADLRDLPVHRLVYTSSAAVYGDNVDCRETDRPRAAGLHAGLKVANEDLVLRVGHERRIPTTVARLFNLYGGEDRFSVISKLLHAARTGTPFQLANGGHAIRDFVHLDDVVRSYTALLDADVDIVNIASGVGVSVRTLLDALALRGIDVPTENRARAEIKVSTASIDRLRGLVDVDAFQRAADWLVAEARA